jgi:N-acetylglucosaminyldiphosphoundecaprenol N-acetyl-beta-D-mannosaminyltransferase
MKNSFYLLPAYANSSCHEEIRAKISILNVDVDNLTLPKLLKNLDKGGIVFTPNVDHLMKLQRDRDFLKAYEAATYRICDSTILLQASHFLGTPIREKIAGSDLLPAFCDYHRTSQHIKVFLLGSAEGVAQKAQYRINRKAQREMVVGCESPSYGFEQDEIECLELVRKINQSNANVLVVGVGAPKQELWIAKYKHLLPNVTIFLALGAAIDFMAGQKCRSPQWMSIAGLEWLHRLVLEPQRLWKRYLVDDMPFFGLILMQKMRIYRSPFRS